MSDDLQPQPKPQKEPSPAEPLQNAGDFDAKESRRKRQTIKIKLPRKPAAPRRVPRGRPVLVPAPTARTIERVRHNDSPLRITIVVIMALLALGYCNFFFEFVRGVPLREDLPMILWPQVVHKLLGIALILGFALFEGVRKELSVRSRWLYCILLGFGTAFFAAQLIIRF